MTRPHSMVLAAAVSMFVLALTLATSGSAQATQVSGNFTYRNGTPAGDRQLHFENQTSRDMYIAATGIDGNFSVDLPPGIYDLRAERGVVLKSDIVVGLEDMSIGSVSELAPLDFRRPFEHEGVSDTILSSAAPATANVHGRPMTALTLGHEAVQALFGPAKPLPPIGPPSEASPYDQPHAPEEPAPALVATPGSTM